MWCTLKGADNFLICLKREHRDLLKMDRVWKILVGLIPQGKPGRLICCSKLLTGVCLCVFLDKCSSGSCHFLYKGLCSTIFVLLPTCTPGPDLLLSPPNLHSWHPFRPPTVSRKVPCFQHEWCEVLSASSPEHWNLVISAHYDHQLLAVLPWFLMAPHQQCAWIHWSHRKLCFYLHGCQMVRVKLGEGQNPTWTVEAAGRRELCRCWLWQKSAGFPQGRLYFSPHKPTLWVWKAPLRPFYSQCNKPA